MDNLKEWVLFFQNPIDYQIQRKHGCEKTTTWIIIGLQRKRERKKDKVRLNHKK
uniref:Uncharacterized protein n=1 Tax=Manihot esculenta TaxID=3983 RepID=A0A2C9VDK2_MANES